MTPDDNLATKGVAYRSLPSPAIQCFFFSLAGRSVFEVSFSFDTTTATTRAQEKEAAAAKQQRLRVCIERKVLGFGFPKRQSLLK